MQPRTKIAWLTAAFLTVYFLPLGHPRVLGALMEALAVVQEYAREHVLLCLVPAFFVAGAVASFLSQASVIRYLGGGAPRWLAYSVASVSGTILAVCSCTVLPLFQSIYRRGAGLGPATAFLYSGPAINALAIILTARVLGWELGLARAVGAVLFSILIGLALAFLYRREEAARQAVPSRQGLVQPDQPSRNGLQTSAYFAVLVGLLIFAAWGRPSEPVGFWSQVYLAKWYIVSLLLLVLGYMLVRWFDSEERSAWVTESRDLGLQMLPLLFTGVLVAGALLGRPGSDSALIPSGWITSVVGGNSPRANLTAAVAGAFMYFATLTEVPILQGLMGSGMGEGPALALLLAGPAISLPSMLVIRTVLGTQKTLAFVVLVVLMATVSGLLYGTLTG